jgi:hypothetical protein
MNDIPPPVERFADNSINLAHYCGKLVNQAYEEGLTQIHPLFVKAGLLTLENDYSRDQMINNFINFSHENWDEIYNRDEKFFDENTGRLFNAWPEEVVSMFRSLFFTKKPNGDPLITEEEKKHIWNTVQSLVKISIHHIHETRKPTGVKEGVIIYAHPEVFETVTDISGLAKKWKIYERLRFI